MAELHRRRRRVRPGADPAMPTPADAFPRIDPARSEAAREAAREATREAVTSAIADDDEEPAGDEHERDAERGLRGLVGGGSSQVGVAAAMRARDATRPTDADLANSETNLVIIRRGWTPPPGKPPV
jgi:hypothetical protein